MFSGEQSYQNRTIEAGGLMVDVRSPVITKKPAEQR